MILQYFTDFLKTSFYDSNIGTDGIQSSGNFFIAPTDGINVAQNGSAFGREHSNENNHDLPYPIFASC